MRAEDKCGGGEEDDKFRGWVWVAGIDTLSGSPGIAGAAVSKPNAQRKKKAPSRAEEERMHAFFFLLLSFPSRAALLTVCCARTVRARLTFPLSIIILVMIINSSLEFSSPLRTSERD